MKTLILLILITVSAFAHAQIETLWETNHTLGNDSLEVFFYKQDSSGNHYTGGAIGLTFFVSKFNSSGVHQWTVSDDRLIDKSPHFNYDTQDIAKSWLSDVVIVGTTLYFSGTKQYWNQWVSNGNSGWNFILKLNSNGDSLAYINVVKEDVPQSAVWGKPGHKPLLSRVDNQIYFFTSLYNWTTSLGTENINVFKYDDSLNLLKYQVFDGILSASRDTVKHVEFFDDKLIIHSMMAYWPRLLACDTALNLIWDTHFRTNPSPNHTTIPFIINDSNIFIYPTTRDTSRKNPPIYYNKFAGHVRMYDLSGILLDSVILFQSVTSDDNISDALIDEENHYLTGISTDNEISKVFVTRLNKDLQSTKNLLLGDNPLGKIELELSDCRLYLSFIDSISTGTVLKLFRLDENLNILSEELYHTGKTKIFSLTAKDNKLYLLSTGKNMLTDTLSLKNLADTVVIAEPIVFTTLPINPRSIELNWQLSGGLNDSVVIYKSTDNENWQLLKSFSPSLLTFTDSSLNPSTRCYYSILAKWQNENSCNELFASDSTPFNTGLNPVKNQSFRIYPNPAYSKIQIESTVDIEEIELLTLTGEIIKKYYQKENIAIDNLIPGFYFIRINRTYTYKIIKL